MPDSMLVLTTILIFFIFTLSLLFIKRIFGSTNKKIIKSFRKIVQQINVLEPEMQSLSDKELAGKTAEFKRELKNGKTLNDLLIPAFAVVREASRRFLGMRHFDVQLIGGMVLHNGMISEMKTGEGKTLVATLAAYLNSLEGKGVHVVTVNDYLVKRDTEWMSKLYNSLGVSVAFITNNLTDEERKEAYSADIVYSTNNELAFDYLRDNMKFSQEDMVQRGFHYGIVDEVDSILIDEARTPLIISGPVEENNQIYKHINKIVTKLVDSDYEVDEKGRTVFLTEDGISRVEELLKSYNLIPENSSLYDTNNMIMTHYIDQALRAHKLFTADKDYIAKDGKVVIIDEFTGRMMEGRRYSDGLHQALEAKENLEIQYENQTLASVTFQNYFRMYNKLSGMTGTAATEAEEFRDIYRLNVVKIPTNVPVKRVDIDDEIYGTEKEKFNAVLKFIEECHIRLQPVLVGTVSIENSEKLSTLLQSHSLKHSVLNARYHEQEAYIIAQAGVPGSITIATNMAGRGTDIQLGGNAEMIVKVELEKIKNADEREKKYQEIVEKVKKDKEVAIKAGGLCVIGTERHESRRIDDQLRGRSGRQGDPGLSKFFLSLEDDLMRIFGSDRMRSFLQRVGLKNNEAIHHPWINKALEKAQKKVEARNYDVRKSLLKFDDVINNQRKVIFKQRNNILNNEINDLVEVYSEVNEDVIEGIVQSGYYEDYVEDIAKEFDRRYGVTLNKEALEEFLNKQEALDYVNDKIQEFFTEKEKYFNSQQTTDLWNTIVKQVMIMTLDHLWREHLSVLESLRQSINLRAMGQKDPLNEFKREAFLMFESMLEKWKELTIHRLAHFKLADNQEIGNRLHPAKNIRLPKVSRNDKCPCNSGKKYKHCHGAVTTVLN
ncbi:preprotein translocase, SecA subunit [Wolbachia endosymbiont of Armadillidium vulgare str. wVulC]|uniref:preprotein translocase subunit SecA n=1 Tax=Wolbachia endosymbiont of Armadillidium vulgare TaxID=77039 RepID=UPI00064B76CD|nr:preprotein translocase subunit SecA [Wolbachia endosymbiont of Armadillidium vulgare]KLT22169.1 preprotein translocase, SecA subunit [Wolbachia endosymbiont of Armadillidium vulgare str. wVulC]OJH31534.1 Protein translocase subunit SecA [Wolbachia endosymbiont of Armadillidium vulgare]OJH32244.1 Protein translocase subunit SecA [Wolbachia endosymbiont of Armadillidium vulgare]OJH32959.1 Protein translocase subunit SecA [Wolbachia endosymbiont of Armadillidium vulgare]